MPTSWQHRPEERRRSGGVRWVAAVALVVVVALLALGVANYDRIRGLIDGEGPAKAWPEMVNGRPNGLGPMGQAAADVEPMVDPGIYLWSDFDGWHLWVVAGEGIPDEVRGSVTSNDALPSMDLAVPESGSASLDGKTGTFSVSTEEAVSGVDFNTGFYATKLDVTLEGPDGPLDAKLVRLGSKLDAAPDPLKIDQR